MQIVQSELDKIDKEVVEEVQNLFAICVPIPVIARTVKLREETVRFAIQRGRLPQKRLALTWPESQR